MASEKQIEANRRNAQRSTGPRTDEGKEQSRNNAIKHGLRSERLEVLPNEDPAAYRERIDAWFEHYQPTDPVEAQLVRRGADLSWKLDRIEKFETAALSKRVRDAMDEAVQSYRTRVHNARYDLLPPKHVIECNNISRVPAYRFLRDVESTADGCRWMLAIWKIFRETAQAGRPWSHEQEFQMIRLFGYGPRPISNPDLLDVVIANRTLLYPNRPLAYEGWYDGPMHTYFDPVELKAALARQPADPAAASAILVQTADARISELEESLAKRMADGDLGVEEGQTAGALALFDPSAEAERLRRYQITLNRELMRTLDTLAKLRGQQARQRSEFKKPTATLEARSENSWLGRSVQANGAGIAQCVATLAETGVSVTPVKKIAPQIRANEAKSARRRRLSSNFVANRPTDLLAKVPPKGIKPTDWTSISCETP